MRTFLSLVVCGALSTTLAVASTPVEPTPVQHESCWWPKRQGDGLATMQYPPSQREQPFFERLPADEIMTGSHAEGYDIAGKDSKYVGWFGIVRKIEEDTDADQTTLTIEHNDFKHAK